MLAHNVGQNRAKTHHAPANIGFLDTERLDDIIVNQSLLLRTVFFDPDRHNGYYNIQMESRKPKQKAKAPRKITPQHLENVALYYLQRYASSSGNLRRVLMNRVRRSCQFHDMDPEAPSQQVEALIVRYQKSGLLNDTVYAQGRVSSLRRQGLSQRNIAEKLRAKGLEAADIRAALAQHNAENGQDSTTDADLAAAVIFCRRKKIGPFRKSASLPDVQARKDLAALARAGFSFDIAKKALAIKETDDDPDL